MRGLGTLINTATVLAGGGVGYFVGHRIPESIRTVVVQVIGLATLVMGVNYVLQSHNLVFPLVGSVIGAIIGELPSGLQSGLGGAILNFNQYYSIEPQELWATNIVAAALGIIFFLAVLGAEKAVVRRAPERRA